jgi:hypothetical protein
VLSAYWSRLSCVDHHHLSIYILFLMAEKQGAYAQKAADTDFRKKWDKAEYAEKARQKDDEGRELAKENEERVKQGAWLGFFKCTAANRSM